jgi:pyridoxal phosphate enzyme (YggS family)
MEKAEIIKNNYELISEKIAKAAQKSGRPYGDIKLVVVTKSQPVDVVNAAILAGAKILGENYPEESIAKIEALVGLPVEWHMIGHLQSRKAKIVANHFNMLQSLDSSSLAQKLNGMLELVNRKLPILLEMNVSGEGSKGGFEAWAPDHWETLLPEVEKIMDCGQLQIQGLMTMPPLEDDPEKARPYMARLRELSQYLRGHFPEANWNELSMGTSSDFEVAIEEGATFVRIGTAIVGPRIYR